MARTTLYPAPRVFPTYRLNRVAKTCTMTSDIGNADVRGVRGSAMDKFLWEDNKYMRSKGANKKHTGYADGTDGTCTW